MRCDVANEPSFDLVRFRQDPALEIRLILPYWIALRYAIIFGCDKQIGPINIIRLRTTFFFGGHLTEVDDQIYTLFSCYHVNDNENKWNKKKRFFYICFHCLRYFDCWRRWNTCGNGSRLYKVIMNARCLITMEILEVESRWESLQYVWSLLLWWCWRYNACLH